MSSYVAYVDQPLAYQLATGLIGSEVAVGQQQGVTAGINFKVIFNATATQVQSTTTKVEHLLPEVLMDALHEAVPNKVDLLDEVWPRLLAGASDRFRPGSPLLLRAATLVSAPTHDPSDDVLAGEECGMVLLKSGSYQIRGFVNAAHAHPVTSLYDEPVEVLGILRYVAPYKVPGATAINLGLRVIGVWLR